MQPSIDKNVGIILGVAFLSVIVGALLGQSLGSLALGENDSASVASAFAKSTPAPLGAESQADCNTPGKNFLPGIRGRCAPVLSRDTKANLTFGKIFYPRDAAGVASNFQGDITTAEGIKQLEQFTKADPLNNFGLIGAGGSLYHCLPIVPPRALKSDDHSYTQGKFHPPETSPSPHP